MARAYTNPQAESLERQRLESYHATLAAEAIILRQEHGGNPKWWENHVGIGCSGCALAALRLG